MAAEVILQTLTLDDLFSGKNGRLSIPDYQRNYCWLPKNVYKLLDDIWNLREEYRLGCVILQRKDGNLNIIDGQQRLITLTLILSALGDSSSPLLTQKIESDEAREYIAYNKYLISNYVNRFDSSRNRVRVQKIKENLTFAVLTLEDTSLDLAYTFFSSQNSKGVKLTSYDLLKSHHLHFIVNPLQAKHMAMRWDDVLQKNSDESCEERVDITLGKYLFRLRKWMFDKDWNDKDEFKVKEEFESAAIIPEIPPFGEQFYFKEPIQGGTHFFAYTDFFINRCREFHQTEMYQCLKKMTGESHAWFRDVMEAHLFAYYLKFGDSYLAESLYCISRIISQYRYEKQRVEEIDIITHERNIMLSKFLDQATSPTFYLAAVRDVYNKMVELKKDRVPIMSRYTKQMDAILEKIKKQKLSSTFEEDING